MEACSALTGTGLENAAQKQTARIAAGRIKTGADERSRTSDLLITNQLLYQLSYISEPLIIAFSLFFFQW